MPIESPFGPVIHSYTRAQALEDGFQVSAGDMPREAGISWPVFLTRAAWSAAVEITPALAVKGQSVEGRLWDVLFLLRLAAKGAGKGTQALQYTVSVVTPKGRRNIRLKAVAGPLDIDDPAPAFTIMLPDED